MLPKVNQILYMNINSVDPEEARQEYKARIADVQPNFMSIEVPLHVGTGKLKRIYVGDEIEAYYIDEGGVKHYFHTYLIGFKEEAIRLVLIKCPEADQITKMQRRSFFRVPAELEVAVKTEAGARFTALTEDIGGGGISFLCEKHIALRDDERLDCWLLLPYRNKSIEHAHFVGEIVRVKPLESGRRVVMARFSEITDAERQRIIRYCFERQLEFRNR